MKRRILVNKLSMFVISIILLVSCDQLVRENNKEPESSPQNVSVISPSYGKVILAWGNVRGASIYEIMYSEYENINNARVLASVEENRFEIELKPNTDPVLSPNTTYYFWIRAKNGTAVSSYSERTFVTVNSILQIPTNFSVSSSDYEEVFLSWDNISGATSYEVFYSEVADFSNAVTLITTDETSATVSLIGGKEYYFKLKAKAGAESSDFSEMKNIRVFDTLSAPNNLSIFSEFFGQVSLSWTAVKKATMYEVFYSEETLFDNATSLGTVTTTNFTTTLMPNKRYYFWVKAKDSTITSAVSSAVSILVNNDEPAIRAPEGIIPKSETYGELSLTWNASVGATEYEVYYAEENNTTNAILLGTTSGTSFKSDKLIAGTTYNIWIKAKKDSLVSTFSTSVSVLISKSIINSVLVEGGTFLRAGGFEITVSSFYMGVFEVTQKQWLDAFGNNPSYNKPESGWYNYPVEQVSWYDAIEFCNALSAKEELTPAYTITKDSFDPSDQSRWTVVCDFEADGYRLPTEAEWEYAANGGIHNSGFIYSGSDTYTDVAHYTRYGTSAEIGTKRPNSLSIYDMSGNVAEWCWDLYEAYPSQNLTDPTGSSTSTYRVHRGGPNRYYSDPSPYLKIGARSNHSPVSKEEYIGIRVVRSVR